MLGLLASLVPRAAARERDWALELSDTSLGPGAKRAGAVSVLYPRPGLAAVVRAGGTLVARVRLPWALTPPPGRQQHRALRGWSVELLGEGLPVAEPSEHRYPLEVTNVRPDSSHTLIYRAFVRLPTWVAPGLYSLYLRTPGGQQRALRSLVVVERGRQVRVGLMGCSKAAEAVPFLPVDVWITHRCPTLSRYAAAVDLPMSDAVSCYRETNSRCGLKQER